MAIPKMIHYCWFGGNPKSDSVKKCIQSWRKKCPNYSIVEWNEENFSISDCPAYVREAYAAGKWAFVTDYVRLKIIYEHGGIYLDTDVELLRDLEPLLNHSAYFGFEAKKIVNTGLGFGAEKGCAILQELMEIYSLIHFKNSDGSYNLTPCPELNANVFLKRGLVSNDQRQVLHGDILILPTICLSPCDFETRIVRKGKDTFSIHWYQASWKTESELEEYRRSIWKKRWIKIWVAFTDLLKRKLGRGYYRLRTIWRFLWRRK